MSSGRAPTRRSRTCGRSSACCAPVRPTTPPPQPTLVGLGTLVAESREAGTEAVLDNRVDVTADVPASVGRTAFRVVQEGLTNARKHPPGAETTVTVTGAPGTGLTVTIHNLAPPDDVPPVPGSGQGLIGLAERATLAGGRL